MTQTETKSDRTTGATVVTSQPIAQVRALRRRRLRAAAARRWGFEVARRYPEIEALFAYHAVLTLPDEQRDGLAPDWGEHRTYWPRPGVQTVIYHCEDLGSVEVWHLLVRHRGGATVLRVEYVPQPWSDGVDFIEQLEIIDDLDDLPDHLVVSLPL